MAWDKDLPNGGYTLRRSDNDIRDNNDALESALDNEHAFATGGAQTGYHTQGSGRAFFQATAPSTRIDGTAFVSADRGSLWADSDDNMLYILTGV